jgi:hypothetical protein
MSTVIIEQRSRNVRWPDCSLDFEDTEKLTRNVMKQAPATSAVLTPN